jgi:heat shock factor-binding protein 1
MKVLLSSVQNNGDLTNFVQTLLTQMQQKFDQMSKTVVDRLDDMGKRIDELEKSVGELINEPVVEDASIYITSS